MTTPSNLPTQPLSGLALVLATLLVTPVSAETTLPDTIVKGQASTANGLLLPRFEAKSQSLIGREAIEQKSGLNNAYQVMDLLPGVNTYSYDASGLFGGGLRLRGFNSDQIGVSIDGAPMNDAGNFAVYPSELVDIENLDNVAVDHSSGGVDTPMVGASGGNIGLNTSAPSDQARLRVQQTYGSYNSYKSFIRGDSGYLDDAKRFKAFTSVSKAETDKWKGLGGADREHLDFKGVLNLGSASSITGGLLVNQIKNNNLRPLTLSQIQTLGQNADWGITPPTRVTPVAGSTQVESKAADGYYGLNLNPYLNYLATVQGRFQLSPNLKLEIDPYYSYGYGTGGDQLRPLAESNAANKLGGGIRDINGDGDSRDTALIYSGAVTETTRPGITTRLRSQWGRHQLLAGYWYEFAYHRRTQPGVIVDSSGNPSNAWLNDPSQYLLRQNGTAFQGRDFLTQNYSQSVFAQDDIELIQQKLLLSLGMRYTEIVRDFNNYPSDSFPGAYAISQRYERPLPSVGLRYLIDEQQQLFINRNETFKAPPDSVLYGLTSGGSFNNAGQYGNYSLKSVNVREETATHWELGYRYQGQRFSASGSLFYIDFQNRIASAYDPFNTVSTNYNVGDSVTKGIELQSAWGFVEDWSLYNSLSITDSRMLDNLKTGASTLELTANKQLPDTPGWMAAAALQYRHGPWSGNLSAKYTGDRYATLVNDQTIPGYTLVSLDAGYRLPSKGLFREPMVRVNVYNLLDDHYLNLNAGSGSTFTARALGPGGAAPVYYLGAPRSISVTLSTDF